MFSIPFSFYSLTTQRLLSQTSNIGYAARGVYRTELAPEDRKADNNFRDYQMSFVTNTLTEVGFRAVQTWYVVPRMTEALGLHRLSEIYGDRYPGMTVKNYDRLPDIIRNRMMGTLVRSSSMKKVPDLLEGLETELLAKGGHGLSAEEQTQLRILLEHLHKNLNFKDYIEDLTRDVSNGRSVGNDQRLSRAEADFVLRQRQRIIDIHGSSLISGLQDANKAKAQNRRTILQKLRDTLPNLYEATATLGTEDDLARLKRLNLEQRFNELLNFETSGSWLNRFKPDPHKKEINRLKWELQEHFEATVRNQSMHQQRLAESLDWKKELPNHSLSQEAKKRLMLLVEDGVNADRVFKALQHIQKNSTWPQMACSVLMTLLFYGLVANVFDVKVLQPWQERLVQKRGTSEAYVKPSYWATGFGLAALGFGMQNKWQLNAIRKLSYFNRFAVVGFGALAAYLASFLLLLKRELNKPVPGRPMTVSPPATRLPAQDAARLLSPNMPFQSLAGQSFPVSNLNRKPVNAQLNARI